MATPATEIVNPEFLITGSIEIGRIFQQVNLGQAPTDPGGGDDGNCDPRPTNGMLYPRRLPVSS